jgi:hypothetical protein
VPVARDTGSIPLEPDTPSDPHKPQFFCPDCGKPMSGQGVCGLCGFDSRGSASGTVPEHADAHHNPKPCHKCGYDLRGIKALRCPECGTRQASKDWRTRANLVARDEYRRDLTKPAVIAGIAYLLIFATTILASRSLTAVILSGLTVAGTTLGAMIVHSMCALLWIGWDSPLRLAFVRVCAAVAVTHVVSVIGYAVGGVLVLGLGSIIVYGLMLWDLFDMDLPEGLVQGLFVVIVWIAVGWGVEAGHAHFFP